ncbi:unnamed protein product [Vicia faba]|uniref:Uncharacterized protein n=1 Tax=Vicia faba TaxID=3906 RepID=A0AAV1B8Q2_VICFA|nr:unnamed protein product [Vicia faba]
MNIVAIARIGKRPCENMKPSLPYSPPSCLNQVPCFLSNIQIKLAVKPRPTISLAKKTEAETNEIYAKPNFKPIQTNPNCQNGVSNKPNVKASRWYNRANQKQEVSTVHEIKNNQKI